MSRRRSEDDPRRRGRDVRNRLPWWFAGAPRLDQASRTLRLELLRQDLLFIRAVIAAERSGKGVVVDKGRQQPYVRYTSANAMLFLKRWHDRYRDLLVTPGEKRWLYSKEIIR